MNKVVFYVLIGLEILLLLAFVLLTLGALVDVKYGVESFEGISNSIIASFYSNIYSFSVIIILQFSIITYLLYKIKHVVRKDR